jgi:hypothetical protein
MSERRFALIIASYDYTADTRLHKLVAPPQDAEALSRVLQNAAIGGFEVKTLLNQPSSMVLEEIEIFLGQRQREDLVLLYFSGHGVKNADGQLYFAMPNTHLDRLRATAIKAQDVNDMMHSSRAKKQILLLDCCYSGAFARGLTIKADQSLGTQDYFSGRGHTILTASDALQYAFEGDEVKGQGTQSIFTRVVTDGLETGEADLDNDGLITVDELYEYLLEGIGRIKPEQKPRKWALDVEGSIVIARNSRWVLKPAELPLELRQAIESPLSRVREAVTYDLEALLKGSHPGFALAARKALEQLAEDDSTRVKTRAAQILQAHARSADAAPAGQTPLPERPSTSPAPESRPVAEEPPGPAKRPTIQTSGPNPRTEQRSSGQAKMTVSRIQMGETDLSAWLSDTLTVSPDNYHYAYVSKSGGFLGIGEKQVLVMDGKPGKRYDSIFASPSLFSTDSQHVVYGAQAGDKWTVVVDGREGKLYEAVAAIAPRVSPESRHVAYGARLGGKWVVVLDGREGKPYDGLGKNGLHFSPDGRHMAYGAMVGEKWMVVVDGRKS